MSAAATHIRSAVSDWTSRIASTIGSHIQKHPKWWAIGAVTIAISTIFPRTDIGTRTQNRITPSSLQPTAWTKRRAVLEGVDGYHSLLASYDRQPDLAGECGPSVAPGILSREQVEWLQQTAKEAILRDPEAETSRQIADSLNATIVGTDQALRCLTHKSTGIRYWADMWNQSQIRQGAACADWDEEAWMTANDCIGFAYESEIGQAVQRRLKQGNPVEDEPLERGIEQDSLYSPYPVQGLHSCYPPRMTGGPFRVHHPGSEGYR